METNLDQPLRILVRLPEAATLLGIGRSTVYGLIADGKIPTVRIGRSVRVPIEALKEWAERLEKDS